MTTTNVSSGLWTSKIPAIISTLSGRNGRYDERTPKMSMADMAGLIGMYAQTFPSAIHRVCPVITRSEFVDESGELISDIVGNSINFSPEVYLFQWIPTGATAWIRGPGGVGSFQPAARSEYVDNSHLRSFLRDAITDYQRCLAQVAAAIQSYPTGMASAPICRLFMSGLQAFASDLEVLGENPPTTFADNFKGAVSAALDASAHAAGEIAAGAGNVIGNVAGSVASGFFSSANLTTIAVAGVVGYVALKRYGI